MKIDSNQKYAFVLILLLVFVGLFLFTKKAQTPVPENFPLEEYPKGEVDNSSTPAEATPEVGNKVEPSTYKELIAKGHELYLKEQYTEALPYFKQALSFGESDRIYRSLYSAYLGLQDYKNAEIAIKKSVGINNSIPNNWVEYASFENYYVKASFEVVSKVYLDGLKATKDDINLITAYASYLVENKKYAEAISYLEKAITIDPARKGIFQAEIEYLRTR